MRGLCLDIAVRVVADSASTTTIHPRNSVYADEPWYERLDNLANRSVVATGLPYGL